MRTNDTIRVTSEHLGRATAKPSGRYSILGKELGKTERIPKFDESGPDEDRIVELNTTLIRVQTKAWKGTLTSSDLELANFILRPNMWFGLDDEGLTLFYERTWHGEPKFFNKLSSLPGRRQMVSKDGRPITNAVKDGRASASP